MSTKFPKDPYFYKAFAQDGCSFCLTDPVAARNRNSIIGPLFSRRAITKLEYLVQEKIDLLITELLKYKTPSDLSSAFRSATLDIIASYCFGRSYDAISYPQFRHPVLSGMEATIPVSPFFRHFNFMIPVFLNLPPWVHNLISPGSRGFNDLREGLLERIDELLKDTSMLEQAEHETIYHHLMTPQPAKGQPEIPHRITLLEESVNLLVAGSDTVGNTCAIGTFHILSNRAIYSKLVKELDEAWPDVEKPMKHETLGKLPYLTAVIKESLRLTHGVVKPRPRVVGPSSVEIAGVEVPTVVSMGATFVHLNEDIFPDPHTFIPDRWMQPNSRELENFLIPFSKGPRACVGINLAWCELYLIFANIFRKLSLEIHETTVEDFKFDAFFLPVFRGKPLQASVTSRLP
jgi:cytochrome P450